MEEITRTGDEYISASEHKNENAAAAEGDIILYLTFLLGNDTFGIKVGEIREVIEYKRVFKVPCVPEHIKGVINLRGEVVPIIDLHSRFYHSASHINNSTSIIIVEIDDENHKIPIGVMIDTVRAVTGIYEQSIELVPEIGSRIKTEYIHGIGKVDDQFVILLKIQNILDLAQLSSF